MDSVQNLGTLLKQNKEKWEKTKEGEEYNLIEEERKRFNRKKNELETFFEEAKENIMHTIVLGRHEVTVSTRGSKYCNTDLAFQNGQLNITEPTNDYNFIWQDFIEWLDNSGLRYNIQRQHDGMGIEAWSQININPRP